MPVLSVIGTQWGDEGKGKVLDWMAERADLVVRYQGGANAGHTVVVGDEKFFFHLLPSGVLHPEKQNVLASGMVIDPGKLIEEIDQLEARGKSLEGRLFLSASAHLVFPYHKALDAASESGNDGRKIGTTGRGIGPAYVDKSARRGLRVGDLYQDSFAERLRANVEDKNQMLTRLYGREPMDAEQMLQQYRGFAERLRPYVTDTFHFLMDALDQGKYVFIEGAQGVLLDLDFGTYPYVTSSNSSVLGIAAGTGIPPKRAGEVIGVAKAYCSRVGEGPFPTELHDETSKRLRAQGHEYGTTTGRPRRCGWFDGVAARFAVRINGVDSLALTKLDTLSGLQELKVCVAYRTRQGTIARFPVGTSELSEVEPVYESLPGFSESIESVRQFSELPRNAQNYVQFLEDFVRVKATLISVGPARDQTILR